QHALSQEFQIVSGPGGVGPSGWGAAGVTSRPKTEEKWVERCEILNLRYIRADDCLLVFREHVSALGFLGRFAADPLTIQAVRGPWRRLMRRPSSTGRRITPRLGSARSWASPGACPVPLILPGLTHP